MHQRQDQISPLDEVMLMSWHLSCYSAQIHIGTVICTVNLQLWRVKLYDATFAVR